MKNYNIIILQEEKYFVAKNIDLWVVSQWTTIDEALINIEEATKLYIEDENSFIPPKKSFLTNISI